MIEMVISGMQTGADIAGLRAAKANGIKTGGYAPYKFLTQDGYKPEWGKEFGVKDSFKGYKDRTWMNVENSDGTIRFAKNFSSPGEICTLNAIKHFKKPYLDIDVNFEPCHLDIIEWIKNENIKVLNVAGNSKQTYPKIEEIVYECLNKVFQYFSKDKEICKSDLYARYLRDKRYDIVQRMFQVLENHCNNEIIDWENDKIEIRVVRSK